MTYKLTLTLANAPTGREAEKSIENVLRGFLLVVGFSATFSSLSDKTFTFNTSLTTAVGPGTLSV